MSGTWAVDPAQSDFGPMPVPSDLVLTVKVEGQDFSVHQTGGGQTDIDLRFNTTGKVMTFDRNMSGPMGDGQMKIVLNKK
jgi:hypothetical protein